MNQDVSDEELDKARHDVEFFDDTVSRVGSLVTPNKGKIK
jgi:hypothetical protein